MKTPYFLTTISGIVAVGVVLFAITDNKASMGSDPDSSNSGDVETPVDLGNQVAVAKIARGIFREDLPNHVLVAIELKNATPPFGQDVLATGRKDKTGAEVFEPIRVKWLQDGKPVMEDVTSLQRTFTIAPDRNEEIALLIRRPQDGNYVLDVSMKALDGTANLVLPAGFRVTSRVTVRTKKSVPVLYHRELGGSKANSRESGIEGHRGDREDGSSGRKNFKGATHNHR